MTMNTAKCFLIENARNIQCSLFSFLFLVIDQENKIFYFQGQKYILKTINEWKIGNGSWDNQLEVWQWIRPNYSSEDSWIQNHHGFWPININVVFVDNHNFNCVY